MFLMEAVGKDRDVRGATADVDHADAQFPLIGREYGLSGSERLQHDIDDVEPCLIGAFDDVLGTADRCGHNVDFGFEPHSAHPEGLTDPILGHR